MTKSLNGVFVPADDEQLRIIWNACALHGFPLDSKGILQLLMLAAYPPDDEDDDEEEDTPDLTTIIVDHLAQNPQQAEALKQAGAKLFVSVFSKFKKPQ